MTRHTYLVTVAFKRSFHPSRIEQVGATFRVMASTGERAKNVAHRQCVLAGYTVRVSQTEVEEVTE